MEMRPYIALHDRGLVPRRVDSTTEVRAAEALVMKRAAQGSVPEGLVLTDFWETRQKLTQPGPISKKCVWEERA